MQNPMQKFRQSSIVFEKPGILSEKLNFDKLQPPYSSIFLLKLRTRFVLTNVCKRVFGIFLILFKSWVIRKN